MPNFRLPGVYLLLDREAPPEAATPTGVTAFVGRCERGPVGHPVTLTSTADFERQFGALTWPGSHLPQSVALYFANGGATAVILRHHRSRVDDDVARLAIGGLNLRAASPGAWGNSLVVELKRARQAGRFHLAIEAAGITERFDDLSLQSADPRRVDLVLAAHSRLARTSGTLPVRLGRLGPPAVASGGSDGAPLAAADYLASDGAPRVLQQLPTDAVVNLLCLPPCRPAEELPAGAVAAAQAWCETRGAILLVDPPLAWSSAAAAVARQATLAPPSANAVAYLPRLLVEGTAKPLVPCGAVAGVIARFPAWQAPAGAAATLQGIEGLAMALGNTEQSLLTPLGINTLRRFDERTLVWGARTRSADPTWRYLSDRRTLLLIESDMRRSLAWVVFEPDSEPLWARVRQQAQDLLDGLFRQGALAGQTATQAYFVRCDRSTMTQADLDAGRLILEVGVAPRRPAEFIIIRLLFESQRP